MIKDFLLAYLVRTRQGIKTSRNVNICLTKLGKRQGSRKTEGKKSVDPMVRIDSDGPVLQKAVSVCGVYGIKK